MNLKIDIAQWDPADKNSIYALSNKKLYRIPYLLKTYRLIAQGKIKKYLIQKDHIILIKESEDNQYSLSWISARDQNTIHLIPFVDISKDDSIVDTHSNKIALYNANASRLTIIDPSIKKTAISDPVAKIRDIHEFLWSKDGQRLIYSDGFGIYSRTDLNISAKLSFPQTHNSLCNYLSTTGTLQRRASRVHRD